MKSYTNYRYRDFCNESFKNEFRDDSSDRFRDFTGSRIKSCDFRGANLMGADFSETAIGRDKKSFQKQLAPMLFHIIVGILLGLSVWDLSRAVFDIFDIGVRGCGANAKSSLIYVYNPYGWLNPFIWIVAFAAAATISQKWLFIIWMGLIGLTVFGAFLLGSGTFMLISGGIILILVAFFSCLFGLYLGYAEGSIAVGMVWMAVAISSSISAIYSWVEYQEMHYAILFAVITLLPASLATQAFHLYLNKVKMSAVTSFQRADLTNAKFVNAVLENCDFVDAKLEGVDWQGAVFRNCQFSQGWSREFQEANPLVEKLPVN